MNEKRNILLYMNAMGPDPYLHPKILEALAIALRSLESSVRELQNSTVLTLPMLSGYFHPKHKGAKIFENHLNPAMLAFIGLLSLSTFR